MENSWGSWGMCFLLAVFKGNQLHGTYLPIQVLHIETECV